MVAATGPLHRVVLHIPEELLLQLAILEEQGLLPVLPLPPHATETLAPSTACSLSTIPLPRDQQSHHEPPRPGRGWTASAFWESENPSSGKKEKEKGLGRGEGEGQQKVGGNKETEPNYPHGQKIY
ncbi:hypothetical protein llap_13603 [Limosa lapponica baueri]|uniref:Uncharacterized protein n=1 Tax=Limosa lapponica baueri TaxID=1758121 RepID=A0A2I0TQS4_LIMLA|nr:hypothetical protein llap_13603 [Limosa lapponica baueri]